MEENIMSQFDMDNNVELRGRVASVRETDAKKINNRIHYVTLAIPRNYMEHDANGKLVRNSDFIEARQSIRNGSKKENVWPYVQKGNTIGITGKMHSYTITDQDGNRRTVQYVDIDDVKLVSMSRKNREALQNGKNAQQPSADAQPTSTEPADVQEYSDPDDMNAAMDSLFNEADNAKQN